MPTEQEIRNVKRRYSIIGEAPALISAIGRAIRVAPHDLSVLVIGESGAGKEFFPKIIHDNSRRRLKQYIAVNCGAIPEGTIDSELFGHVKGAFTGAISDHKGYFEVANGGTIFLDEVAEMPLGTQARLLRVLESGEFMKVGSSTVQKTDIRVVAATNKDLEQAIKEGRFREDLYYRLSTVQIDVPSLRDRGDDVLMLSRKFLNDFCEEKHIPHKELTDDARQVLLDYHWPGNVRQLRSVMLRLSVLEEAQTIDRDIINKYMPNGGKPHLPSVVDNSAYDYTREREIIFMLIKELQDQISELKSKIPTTNNVPRVTTTTTELLREKQLAINAHDADNTPSIVHQHQPVRIDASNIGHVDEVQAYDVSENANAVKTLDETEREVIEEALRRNNGRRKRTAQELQISERTLYRKIKQYDLERR